MKRYFLSKHSVIIVLLAAFFLRLALSFFGTYRGDFYTFIGWSTRLIFHPLSDFYREWSDYLPGYLYVLFVLAKIGRLFPFVPEEVLYKLPAIISDLFTGFLIYRIVADLKNRRVALWASFAYLFNPAVFANSTLWGQVDSLTILFPLLSLYFFEKSLPLSSFFLAFGFLFKVQAALAVIPILFLFWVKKLGFMRLFSYGAVSVAAIVILFLPFLPFDREITELPLFIVERIKLTLGQYPYLSVNAFNFWGLFGFWKPDREYLSSVFSVIVLSFVSLFSFLRLKGKKEGKWIILALVFAVSFLFFPRMHERHFLPVFAPLAISSVFYPSLWLVYISFSFSYILNLRYSFVWLTEDMREIFSNLTIEFVILVTLVLFVFWLFIVLKGKKDNFWRSLIGFLKNKRKMTNQEYHFPKIRISPHKARLLLVLILLFSFLARVYRLSRPEHEYFDEVYHAFTARLMLHGDPKAWEWWNPHPQGFAYEWSHPPLAKLGMQAGMRIFGENAFGWRFPAALLGTLSVLLVYLLTKEVFDDEIASLFSAFVFSLDGLFLVSSRIGMNDVYVLFFSLLSVYLFIKEKHLFSALALGLAFSSKWSALWVLPVIFSSFFVFRKKLKQSYFWFLVLPPLVYVASYTQMFLTGHSFDIFWGVQKQMWWYHTGLKATHPYTSPWWSWPFLLRPIWLYTTSFADSKVANIYAFGNPLVFWFGIWAVSYCFYQSWRLGLKRLAWIVFSYLVFFVPWSISPRIMFLYHYLPSIPFMSIAIAFVLRKNLRLALPFFVICFFLFVYFYPHLIGMPVSRALDSSYYWLSSWR